MYFVKSTFVFAEVLANKLEQLQRERNEQIAQLKQMLEEELKKRGMLYSVCSVSIHLTYTFSICGEILQ